MSRVVVVIPAVDEEEAIGQVVAEIPPIADEVIALLASDPNATISITLEIDAEFANGASDTIKRGVSENATSLGFKAKDWE